MGNWEWDIATDTVTWSDELYRIYDVSPEDFGGNYEAFVELMEPGYRGTVKEMIQRALKEREPFVHERRIVRPDGEDREIEARAEVFVDESGEPVRMAGTVQDVTERKRAEEELRKSEARNRAIIEASPDLMFRVDRDGKYLDFQASGESRLYVPPGEIVGKNLRETMPSDLIAPMLHHVAKAIDTGEMQVLEYQLSLPEGPRDFEARLVSNSPGEALTIVRDITERKNLEKQLEHRAFHDPLTGLPNRALLRDRLKHALARSERSGNRVALLFLDLDNFKLVNDSLGHEAGDRLLVKVSERLKDSLRPEDTLARFGGDEFVVVLQEIPDEGEAPRVSQRIMEVMRRPLTVEGRELSVTTSIGIALSSSSRDQPETLLRNADTALYKGKARGKGRYEMFDSDMYALALKRLSLESDLRKGIERGEFRVYYQPKVRLDNRLQQRIRFTRSPAIVATSAHEEPRIAGMEALVRWEHPERGLVSPDEFIPIAEETGLVFPIGQCVLEEACRQARVWQEQYPDNPKGSVCVNLSARQFQEPGLIESVARVLRETGLDPCSLCLEITESVLMEDAPHTVNTLQKLKDLGVELAVDDFGTGYSSLAYLKRFPVTYLKIDRSFIGMIDKSQEDVSIVSAIVKLAQTLDIQVVAEGIESTAQLKLLEGLGCTLAQGFYFSQPVPGEAASDLLAAGLVPS